MIKSIIKEVKINDVELTSKFSNIYIMLLYALMNNDIKRVAHYLSDDMFEKYNMIIQTNIKNNETQQYDELNVHKIKNSRT